MAKREEDIILNLEIEQKDALSELDRLKKSIIGIKQEQDELKKAYKAGAITLDEFAKGSVRLEGLLKAQTSAYNNLQKSATGVKTQMDKLIDSNKQLSNTTKDALENVRIHGVGLSDLTTKMAGLLTPAGAAVAVFGTLAAAYSRSTIGAKDLAFAQSQLSEATTLITNRFAALISSAEDGEGAMTRILNNFISFIANSPLALGLKVIGIDLEEIRKKAHELALIQEQLEDKQREEADLRVAANDRLADNQELLTEIQSEQTSYNQKLGKAEQIKENINQNEREIKANLEEQLAIVNKRIESDKNNEALLDAQKKINAEISALHKDTIRKVQAIERLQQNITEQNEKQLNAEINKNAEIKKRQELESKKKIDAKIDAAIKSFEPLDNQEAIQKEKEFQELLLQTTQEMGGKRIEIENQTEEQIAKNKAFWAKKSADAQMAEDQNRLQSAAMVAGALSNLFQEKTIAYKVLASAQALIDTYRAATAALAPPPVGAGPILGPAFAIAAVATGLANVAKINSVDLGGKAAGGGHFYTKGPALLMVGDNPGGVERVSVEPISGKGQTKLHPNSNLVAMAGGGTISPASMAATRALTNPINMRFRGGQQKLNLKVSWAEGKEMDRAVAFKERLTTL